MKSVYAFSIQALPQALTEEAQYIKRVVVDLLTTLHKYAENNEYRSR